MDLIYLTNDKEIDMLIMTQYISMLEIKSGTNRKKQCKTGGSMLYGVTWRGYLSTEKDTGKKINRTKNPNGNGFLTQSKVKYPWFGDLCKEFTKLYCNDFKWSQIMINENYSIGWHYDKKNVGLSYLVTFGDYEGGLTELEIETEDDTKIKFPLNTYHSPLCFNGSQIKHRCMPFKGKRYALVFFNN